MVFLDYFFRMQAFLSIGTLVIIVTIYIYRKVKYHTRPLRDSLKQAWLTLFIR